MSIKARSLPASAKAWAIAFPMPLAPPVTKEAFPSNLIFSKIPIAILLQIIRMFHLIYPDYILP